MQTSNPSDGQDAANPAEPARMPEAASLATLGVGALIGDSFSILMRYCLPILAIYLLPDLLIYQATVFLTENSHLVEANLPAIAGSGDFWATAAVILLGFLVYSLETALFVLLAYDAKLGQSLRFGYYLKTLATTILPLLLLSLVVLLLLIPAALALLIPALWVNAVFIAVIPSVVTERTGYGALQRSIDLTRSYRWPIVGAILLGGIFSQIMDIVGEKLSDIALTHGNALLEAVVYVAISGLGYAFLGILTALTYVRLREIKEGIGVEQIAAVFD